MEERKEQIYCTLFYKNALKCKLISLKYRLSSTYPFDKSNKAQGLSNIGEGNKINCNFNKDVQNNNQNLEESKFKLKVSLIIMLKNV